MHITDQAREIIENRGGNVLDDSVDLAPVVRDFYRHSMFPSGEAAFRVLNNGRRISKVNDAISDVDLKQKTGVG